MNFKVIGAVVLFAVVFGFQSLITSQIITMDRYIWEAVFIVSMLIILLKFFQEKFRNITKNSKTVEIFFLILISLCFHFVSIYFILKYCNQPIWPFESKGASFLLMNKYFIWVKPLDVLLQQTLIVLLITRLSKLKLSIKRITLLCIIGFGAIHFFQVLITDSIVGLGYAIGATLFSLIIPYMIIKVKNGYIYNFMIHMAAYDIAALLAWNLY